MDVTDRRAQIMEQIEYDYIATPSRRTRLRRICRNRILHIREIRMWRGRIWQGRTRKQPQN